MKYVVVFTLGFVSGFVGAYVHANWLDGTISFG